VKKTILALLTLVLVFSGAVIALSEEPPAGAVPPQNGTCPPGYALMQFNMGMITMTYCVPMDQGQGPTPPPPPPDNNGGGGRDRGGNDGGGGQGGPPGLGSPPPRPGDPQGFQAPDYEKNKALQEGPSSDQFSSNQFSMAVRRNNLYVYYRGRYTSRAATFQGRWLPMYVNIPNGGNLSVQERYYSSGRVRNYNWGWRPGGWTKFWFYADTRGWHALIPNVNGAWGNWVWVYVY